MTLPKWATTVTPFSKAIAIVMLVILPFLGFYLGMNYQRLLLGVREGQENEIVEGEETMTEGWEGRMGIANPAAVYCREQGGENKIVTAEDRSQRGECRLEDGRVCDDWEYYRTKVCEHNN